jgi:RNA polymerase sigma-70 factor, ECF subfamily
MPSARLATPAPLPSTPAESGACAPAHDFESVYRAHSRTVGRWAAALLGPTQDCEDVMQEVFLVVRRRLPEFRGDAEITTWLYEITVRVVQRFRRRAHWWSWITGRGQHPGRGRARERLHPDHQGASDPQATLEAKEMTRVLYQLLDGLSDTQRTAFILYELEGLSGEQIAAITGSKIRTVWVRLSRARHKFLAGMRAWEERERP